VPRRARHALSTRLIVFRPLRIVLRLTRDVLRQRCVRFHRSSPLMSLIRLPISRPARRSRQLSLPADGCPLALQRLCACGVRPFACTASRPTCVAQLPLSAVIQPCASTTIWCTVCRGRQVPEMDRAGPRNFLAHSKHLPVRAELSRQRSDLHSSFITCIGAVGRQSPGRVRLGGTSI
jgi:hypothetical protein